MARIKARVLAAVLALALAAAALAALPSTAFAATDPVSIDVSLLGTVDVDNSADAATDSQWAYYTDDHSNINYKNTLRLSTPGGNYLLTGVNPDIRINTVDAPGANIVVAGLDITSNNLFGLRVVSCTITLVGDNSITATEGDSALLTNSYSTCEITSASAGTLTLTGTSSASVNGIHVFLDSVFRVTGNAEVTASGSIGMRLTDSELVYVGPDAKLNLSGETGNGISFLTYLPTPPDYTLHSDGSTVVDGGYQGINAAGGPLTIKGTGTADVSSTAPNAAVAASGLTVEACTATLNGGLSVGAGGLSATGGAGVNVNGDIESGADGVNANAGAVVSVTGDINAVYCGVNASDGAHVTVTGDINAGIFGAFVTSGSTAIITGNITSGDDGIAASEGSTVTMTGDIDAGDAGAFADDATVTMTGDILSVGPGAISQCGALVTITGTITTGGDVAAYENGTLVITGDVIMTGTGSCLNSDDGASLKVTGNVTSSNLSQDTYYAVIAQWDATIEIEGDVTSNKRGVYATDGSQVTIDGDLTVGQGMTYVAVSSWDLTTSSHYPIVELSASQYAIPTTKAGFLTYTDGVNTVWVRGDMPEPPTPPQPTPATQPSQQAASTPPTGDRATMLLGLAVLLSAVGALNLASSHKRRHQRQPV